MAHVDYELVAKYASQIKTELEDKEPDQYIHERFSDETVKVFGGEYQATYVLEAMDDTAWRELVNNEIDDLIKEGALVELEDHYYDAKEVEDLLESLEMEEPEGEATSETQGHCTISDYLMSGGPGIGSIRRGPPLCVKKVQKELNKLDFDTEISVTAKDGALYVKSNQDSVKIENAIDDAGCKVVDGDEKNGKFYYYFVEGQELDEDEGDEDEDEE